MSSMSSQPKEPPDSEITPEAMYLRRREFIKNAALFTGATVGIGGGLLWLTRGGPAGEGAKGPGTRGAGGGDGATGQEDVPEVAEKLKIARRGQYTVSEEKTPYAS